MQFIAFVLYFRGEPEVEYHGPLHSWRRKHVGNLEMDPHFHGQVPGSAREGAEGNRLRSATRSTAWNRRQKSVRWSTIDFIGLL